jgi:thiol-disulfide isomerase/thioredoxin
MRPLFVRFFRRLVVAATLVASLVAPARSSAQAPAAATQPADTRLPNNPADYVPQVILPLLHTPQVQAELGIEGAKLAQLEQLFATVDGDWWRARNLPPAEQRAAITKVEKAVKTWLTGALPRERLVRLADLERRAQGGRVLLREDVAEVVGLEPAQQEKLLAAARATESAAAALGRVFQTGGGQGDLEKAALLAARERELKLPGDLLSEEQQKEWRRLVGAPFDTVTLDRIYPMAPELAPSATWINAKPLALAGLRGKVVILHFYAFECVNCQRNLPIYAEWHRAFADKGVVVIGVQTPETQAEQDSVKVIAAAKAAHLHEFVEALPDGYDAKVGERGLKLSGGEKQRVAIARAFAVSPQVLVLDEPFGALDAITKEELQEELLKIWNTHQCTVLMITHDIDEALFLADRLVMMTNGPAAGIGEVLSIDFPRPRNREEIMEDPSYYELRNNALDFLYNRFAHDDDA